MTLLAGSSLFLAFLVAVVLVLSLFRTRRRRRDVSALFLWEGLREDPRSRAVRRRIPLDLLLALQVASLLLLVFALAEPAFERRTTSLADLAIVIDGSASMRTVADGSVTRYDAAIAEAERVLDENIASRTTVISLSARPEILIAEADRRADVRRAIAQSGPTNYADGTAADLLDTFGGLGGITNFERVILISDHTISGLEKSVEPVLVGGGTNWSIDAFTARENPVGSGILAFVRISNPTDEGLDATLKVDDGYSEVTLSVYVPAGGEEAFSLPFPGSRGSAFTASLGPIDDFPDDNVRYFSLERPIDLRVAWIGESSRYLLAALEAVVPVILVDRSDPADLTVVYGTSLPEDVSRNALVIHGGVPGLVEIGEDVAGGEVIALQPDHPLLEGVDEASLRVASVPLIEYLAQGDVILAAEETPLLVEFVEEDRTITFLAPDLLDTNLPITVDFPVLVRNIVSRIVRLPASVSHLWSNAGAAVPLQRGAERISSVVLPGGERVSVSEEQILFVPSEPGFYELSSSRGTYPLAVNISPTESAASGSPADVRAVTGATEAERRRFLWPFWPWIAGLAILALLLEAAEYSGHRPSLRRTR